MARKKTEKTVPAAPQMRGVIAGAGEVAEQPITETLRQNFMPYAMSVIISRALPEIDGLSRRTANYYIRCTKWDCWAPTTAPNRRILWAKP